MNYAIRAAIALSFLVGLIYAETCISCTSRTSIGCVTNSSYETRQECPTGSNIGCYRRIFDGHTVRGCMADLDEETQKRCVNDTFTDCLRCFGISGRPTCNDDVFPHNRLNCFQCDGELSTPCGEQMTYLNSFACPLFREGDRCYIWRTANKIERGCLSSSGERCSDPQNCFTCDGHGCNLLDHRDSNIPVAPGSAAIQSATLVIPVIMIFLSKMAII